MITKLKAITDSLIKWDYARETGCHYNDVQYWIDKTYPNISHYRDHCGLCEYSEERMDFPFREERCKVCPLVKVDESCFNRNSTYHSWVNSDNIKDRKKYARKTYNNIYSLLTDKQKESIK